MRLLSGTRTVAATAALLLAVAGVVAPAAATPPPRQADPSRAEQSAVHGDAAAARLGRLPRLRGTVGPGFTITISRQRVEPGRYRLVVDDQSSEHNWHLTGPGVERSTTVGGTGQWVWRVRLREGRYTIVCDPHSDTLRTRLRVRG